MTRTVSRTERPPLAFALAFSTLRSHSEWQVKLPDTERAGDRIGCQMDQMSNQDALECVKIISWYSCRLLIRRCRRRFFSSCFPSSIVVVVFVLVGTAPFLSSSELPWGGRQQQDGQGRPHVGDINFGGSRSALRRG
eukprot:711928-Hanusia_phi.AAC.1